MQNQKKVVNKEVEGSCCYNAADSNYYEGSLKTGDSVFYFCSCNCFNNATRLNNAAEAGIANKPEGLVYRSVRFPLNGVRAKVKILLLINNLATTAQEELVTRANKLLEMTKRKSDTYRKGLALLNKLHGGHTGEQLVSNLQDICPDFADMTIEWAMHGIMARPGLDLLTREYVIIASCVTLGHATLQLEAHIEAALGLGATKEQIVEVILQMLFYAGGAATSNALATAKKVFEKNSDRAKRRQ